MSLREAIDTTTASGRLMLHVFATIAEFERHLIRQRTNAGLAATRARGRVGGRPPVLTGDKLRLARGTCESKAYTITAIAKALGVSLYRCLPAQ